MDQTASLFVGVDAEPDPACQRGPVYNFTLPHRPVCLRRDPHPEGAAAPSASAPALAGAQREPQLTSWGSRLSREFGFGSYPLIGPPSTGGSGLSGSGRLVTTGVPSLLVP